MYWSPVTTGYFLSIVFGTALANLARVYLAQFRAWKAARTEIPAYRDWRGRYVPDLHFIRIKRAIIWAWVFAALAGVVFGYVQMTTPGLFDQHGAGAGTERPAE